MPVRIETLEGTPTFYYHETDGNKPVLIATGKGDQVCVDNFVGVRMMSLNVEDVTNEEHKHGVGARISYMPREYSRVKVQGDMASVETRTLESGSRAYNMIELQRGGMVTIQDGTNVKVRITHGFDLFMVNNEDFLRERASARRDKIPLREQLAKRYL